MPIESNSDNDGAKLEGSEEPLDTEDEEPEAKPEAKRSLADKVEDTIRAVLDFVRSYAHTLRFALSPKGLPVYTAELHKTDKLLIRPLTFLCCSFIPAAVILDLSSDTIWDFLLSPETAASRIVERLETISPLKIVLGSVPVLIAIYLGSALLSKIVVRNVEKRVVFTGGMCYAYGMQFFGISILLLLLFLSHTRISEQVMDPRLLGMLLVVFFDSGLFYLIFLGAVAYPFIVAVRLLWKVEPSSRSWRGSMVPIAGVVVITLSTYWLGVLPSRFRAAMTHEEKVGVELIDSKLQVVPDKSPGVDMKVLVKNPTRRLVLIPVTGLTVRLKLTSDGRVIPRNSFHVQLMNVQNNPFLTLRPDDATWVEGRIFPNSADWQLLGNNQTKGGSIQLELSLRNADGNEVKGTWRDITLEGTWPAP